MFSLHDDKIIAFENRDVATLLPSLPATLIEKIESALATAYVNAPDEVTWSDKEHGAALETCEADTWAEALRQASDAVLEACNDVDPDNTNETVTKVMQAAQTAILALTP